MKHPWHVVATILSNISILLSAQERHHDYGRMISAIHLGYSHLTLLFGLVLSSIPRKYRFTRPKCGKFLWSFTILLFHWKWIIRPCMTIFLMFRIASIVLIFTYTNFCWLGRALPSHASLPNQRQCVTVGNSVTQLLMKPYFVTFSPALVVLSKPV